MDSETDGWVVGSQRAGGGAKAHPAAEHWDGSAWTLVGTPFEGLGESALGGVAAITAGDVWAVGHWQPAKETDTAFHTLTEHWDGLAWSIVPSPTVAQSGSNTLIGVSAASTGDVWAVGYYFDANGVRRTLAEHWDGGKWSLVPTPDPGGSSDALLGVRAVSATDVWAVGFTSAGYGYAPLILRYDGASWTQVPAAPDPGSPEGVLAAVDAASSADVWTVGYHVVGGDVRTLVERFDGSSWTVQPSVNGADGVVSVVDAVSALPGDVWAGGFGYSARDGRYKEFTEHLAASTWSVVPAALSSAKEKSELYALARPPGSGAVWASARSAHIEAICPGAAAVGAPRAPSRGGPFAAAAGHGFVSRPGRPFGIPGVVRAQWPALPAAHVAVPTATDAALPAGIAEVTRTHGAVVADFNGDGWPDLFVNRHQNPAELYLNDRDGTFTLVDAGTFPHHDRHGCAGADVNGDGLLDIFCNTGSDHGTEAKQDELWIQQQDGNFRDEAAQYGILEPFDRGRISTFVDANGDGLADVFAANYSDREDGMPSPNRLFLNMRGTAYSLAPQLGLDDELGGTTISVGDDDGDGYDDLLVVAGGEIHLFHNDHGTGFTEVSQAVGLAHRASAAQFVDFNRDGKLDVVEVRSTKVRVDIQQGNGTFRAGPSATATAGFKVAVGDVNGDGWPDVYVEQAKSGATANAPDFVLLNDGTGTGFAPTTVSVPSPKVGGNAEDVVPIDVGKDGVTDFLLENGNGTRRGSLQLIEFSQSGM